MVRRLVVQGLILDPSDGFPGLLVALLLGTTLLKLTLLHLLATLHIRKRLLIVGSLAQLRINAMLNSIQINFWL